MIDGKTLKPETVGDADEDEKKIRLTNEERIEGRSAWREKMAESRRGFPREDKSAQTRDEKTETEASRSASLRSASEGNGWG